MKREIEIITKFAKSSVKNQAVLDKIKRKIAKKDKGQILGNTALLEAYHSLVKAKRIKPDNNLEGAFRIKKIRSLSGIVVVSVLTKPYPCPGKCIFCPTQAGAPKSYIKEEPAVSRAIMLNYHPYRQVQTRIRALEATGHPTDKIDLRIIGATWSFYPRRYQSWFIKECFRAANEFKRKKSRRNYDLVTLQKANEKTKHRIIGIMIETRPDFINLREIQRLRSFGITMVELGVQSIYDNVLKANKRGHLIYETIQATRILKDAGFKICYQMMPNLLSSNMKMDLKMFEQLFINPDFRPDYLKIYPCALLKEANLFEIWQQGKYKPYSANDLIGLLTKIKKNIPYYCRIQRIIRDIPSSYVIDGGAKISNMRQMLEALAKRQGWQCKCIRCREVKDNFDAKEKLYLFREDYDASQGKEIFLSFENKKRTKLYSLLRLRIPSFIFHKKAGGQLPELKNSAIIREVHTYGQLVGLFQKSKFAQHKGLGKKLVGIAQSIAKKEFHLEKMAVISGIGVKNYYRHLGYRTKKTYMIKRV